ncbi:phosphoribosyltransferase family protein [Belliella kenyensis]|uniref:Phosphoribosyltransferase family protein n=1 Tax=Belliella kenyensis TaxID=1472724 RepID=A0ABV8EQQ6_9BACT|nr:phosphoribosyltransferase family protein [Belliella kenyensis]MCH7402907.1 phosphoribosyltransferase [Belliella kenyensis]MDN3602613.1 phosphoribosyltransferase family protein [Belliella kenyensis]
MSENRSQVLDHRQVNQKITRMAYEIYERNASEEEIVFAGISGMGYTLAKLLADNLQQISPIKPVVVEVRLDKSSLIQGEVSLSPDVAPADKCIVLVDDVLNTGKTLAYSLKPFLEITMKKMEIAVLVNRSHKLFPVSPDYTGLELSTTLSEHIAVDLSQEPYTVYLH